MMERKPEWLKIKIDHRSQQITNLLREKRLVTVCEEAKCPNRNECFSNKTATFMILGHICTRNCRYCDVTSGRPDANVVDDSDQIVEAIDVMGLNYVVVTSVDRDDLPDGGAFQFVKTIEKVKAKGAQIEVLTPDFQFDWAAVKKVVDAKPDVYNHNIEAPKRIFKRVRPIGSYEKSLALLQQVKGFDPEMTTKSGLIVGMGETKEEVFETLRDLRAADVDIVTIGQYLRPTKKQIEMVRYVHPDEFKEYTEYGLSLGFKEVYAGPFVRSSYHAAEVQAKLKTS
jgi:lipoyl synthase